MAKNPADQFYWADWLRDPALQAAGASTRGIWMNLLAHMWFAEERGKLSGTEKQLTRLGNCTDVEFAEFLVEMDSLEFGDIVTCNGDVTLKNRRMNKDQTQRNKTRERVKRHRDKQTDATAKEDGNGAVTDVKRKCTVPSSSSSTSSPKDPSSDIENNSKSKNSKINDENGAKAPSKNNGSKISDKAIAAVRKKLQQMLKKDGPNYWEGTKACRNRLDKFLKPLVIEAQKKASKNPAGYLMTLAKDQLIKNKEEFKVATW